MIYAAIVFFNLTAKYVNFVLPHPHPLPLPPSSSNWTKLCVRNCSATNLRLVVYNIFM